MYKIIGKFQGSPIQLERFSAVKHIIGFKGCGLSHMGIIKNAKRNRLPSVLILEDDCKPTIHLKNNWPSIKQWLDLNMDKWDIFTGGNTYYSIVENKKDNIKSICKLKDNIKLYYTGLLTTSFIYVNSKIYDTMLEWETDMDIPIDMWLNKNSLKIVSSSPFIAIQEDDFSNITKSNVDYKSFFENSEKIINDFENNDICE